MKILTAFAVSQLFLIATGTDITGEPKKVGCFYKGVLNERYRLNPEEIDALICSNLYYLHATINTETDEIVIAPANPAWDIGGEDHLQRLVNLKAVNPDLKLILLIPHPNTETIVEPSRRANVINNGIKWLNESGFDGLGFPFFFGPQFKDKMADLICDMKSEFDKHGYMVTALLQESMYENQLPAKEDYISKLSRCCDEVTLVVNGASRGTHHLSPMNKIKSNLEWFLERGLPANKTRIAVPSFGIFVRLEDPEQTGLGAEFIGHANRHPNMSDGSVLPYKELRKLLNDSSMGWTIRRDENTKELYAFSKTGLWTSYEDPESLSFKARYVLEKGLKGMDIVTIDTDDKEGFAGEGRFPLTRAIYNTFSRQNQPVDTTP